jgi:pyruvate dehydrogenase E2 component (dihydrolipoamide acetyltransferase)
LTVARPTHDRKQTQGVEVVSWKIGMPNLGHTMEEGKVSEWLKRVGQTVSKGEVIAVVESDKASFDVDCPADGVLLAIHAPAGTVVLVGSVIAEVGAPGAQASSAAPAAAASAPAAEPAAAPSAPAPSVRSGRVKISPAARALAEGLGVDPQDITPAGDDGMITRDDVRAHAEAKIGAAASVEAPASTLAPAATVRSKSRIKPLSAMRRAIAEATARSWQTIPHVPLHGHADVSVLQASGLNLTAAVARASALALMRHPSFNGCLIDQGFEQAGDVNLAVAVSTESGLLTVVMPAAQSQSVAQLQAQLATLAQQARAGTLAGQRMLGGSFTISSLGRWGVDAFAPIIAAPQVAILGIGAVQRVAREGEGGSLRFVSELALTLVFDHRANDGVQAAQLLAAIVNLLEHPEQLEVTP